MTNRNRSRVQTPAPRKISASQVLLANLLKEAAALEKALAPIMAEHNKAESRCAAKLHRFAGMLRKSSRRMTSAQKARIHNRLLQLEGFAAKANTPKQMRQVEAAIDGMMGGHNYGRNLSDNRAYYDTNGDGELDIPTGDEGQSAILSYGAEPKDSAIYPRTASAKGGRRRLADLFDVDPFGMGDVAADSAIMDEDLYGDSSITDDMYADDMGFDEEDDLEADIYPDGSLPDDDWSEDRYSDEDCDVDMASGMGMDFADQYGGEDCCADEDDMDMAGLDLDDDMYAEEDEEGCESNFDMFSEDEDYDEEEAGEDCYADEDDMDMIGMEDSISEGVGFIDDMDQLDTELEEMTARLARRNLRRRAS
jgi:hypothetical protein